MVIGFLGKGGSGKTTLATNLTHYLVHTLHKKVLAVDVDHNMDFAYNLGQEDTMPYIGQGYGDILAHMDISTPKALIDGGNDYFFSLSPLDPITEKYTKKIHDSLYLMVAGPHTESMMYGSSCSHGLTQPVRTYLPFLKLNDDEVAVVDEKAGADGVGTGITVGFTVAVIVAEATPHGIKAAKQIKNMLSFYNTPYVFVLNKIRDMSESSLEQLELALGEKAVCHIPFDEDVAFTDDFSKKIEYSKKLYESILTIEDTRKERAKERLKKLVAYEKK